MNWLTPKTRKLPHIAASNIVLIHEGNADVPLIVDNGEWRFCRITNDKTVL